MQDALDAEQAVKVRAKIQEQRDAETVVDTAVLVAEDVQLAPGFAKRDAVEHAQTIAQELATDVPHAVVHVQMIALEPAMDVLRVAELVLTIVLMNAPDHVQIVVLVNAHPATDVVLVADAMVLVA